MLDFKQEEKKILEFWEKNKIYEKVKKKNAKGKKFYFLQGPPYTSGKLHIGHAWNNSLKDIILRYKRMCGFNVWDRGGYDMHGLPTENAVQKKLGFKYKEQILKYGMEKFVKECKAFSIEHAGYMSEDLLKLGVWLDHKNAYMPITNDYIEGEWALFKKAWEQNRLYRGEKIMHWDAQSETAMAKHELEYETITEDSIFLKFKSKEKGKRNEYFIIWTTTPWTIPFNLGIMVNPDLDYVRAKIEDTGETWIVAKNLANVFISGIAGKKFKIIDEFKGDRLEGIEYEHPLYSDLKEIYNKLKEKWPKVHTILISKEYVDTTAGTGLVHSAPGCGPEDFEVAQKYGIGAFNTLNESGEFKDLGKFSGLVAKEDDKKFIEEFKDIGVLIATTKVSHEYPHSWRSHKPVIFRPTEQWFLKIEDIILELLKFNSKVKWQPERSGEDYKRWTENLKDNSVSRQRFWGCPLPIWVNIEDKNDFFVIGSIKELEKLAGKSNVPKDLHKPYIDKVIIKNSGKEYKRVDDVADVWIDSGTASWNCLYNDPKLIKKWFPADLVLEATEQTRLWFNMLQICSAIMFSKSAYKNVFVHGMILDYQGTKMSKSLGNIISPYEVLDKYSADILRYYICQTKAGENINFSWEDIKVKQRNLLILSNIANYIKDLESQNLKKGIPGIEERWITSKYHSFLKRVTEMFESYKLDETIGEIEDMFLSLSRDYIKLVREKANSDRAVLDTVKEIYLGLLQVFSTVCPFITDSLWRELSQEEESIHLCLWPKYDKKKIDVKLEAMFSSTLEIIEKSFSARDRVHIGLKWPLANATITLTSSISPANYLQEMIKSQINVKKIKIKVGSELSVELDTTLTPELEAEGFAREISRAVQAERKKAALVKTDLISLSIFTDKELINKLKKFKDFEKFIKERTGAKELNISSDKEKSSKGKFKNSLDIRGKHVEIGFSKL